jgi:hypothetical protein
LNATGVQARLHIMQARISRLLRRDIVVLICTNTAFFEATDEAAGASTAVHYTTQRNPMLCPQLGQRPTFFAAPFLGSNAAHVAVAQVKVPVFALFSQSPSAFCGFTQSPQTCSGFVGPTLT